MTPARPDLYDDPVVVRCRPWQVIGSEVAMAVIVFGAIAGALLAPALDAKALCAAIVLSLGWAVSISVRRVLPAVRAGTAGYTIDESGIHGLLEVPFVAWTDVASVEVADKRSTGVIELTLIDYEKYVPARLQTRRHRRSQAFVPAAMKVFDLVVAPSTNPYAAAGASLTAWGDAKDLAAAARDISNGLLRVPTLGFDHSADDVLAAIQARLTHEPRVSQGAGESDGVEVAPCVEVVDVASAAEIGPDTAGPATGSKR